MTALPESLAKLMPLAITFNEVKQSLEKCDRDLEEIAAEYARIGKGISEWQNKWTDIESGSPTVRPAHTASVDQVLDGVAVVEN